MKICFDHMEGNTFIVHYKNNKIVVNRRNSCAQINCSDSDVLSIELDTSDTFQTKDDLKNWKNESSLKQKCAVVFIFFFIFLYDIICMDIKHLADFIVPLQETYYLKISSDVDQYKLTYHQGEFEILTHKYCYPYMMIHEEERLKHKFSIDLLGIEVSFWLAKLYYFYLLIPIAFVVAVGIGAIWHSYKMMAGGAIFSAIIYLISMNIYLTYRKKQLIMQLKKEL